MKREKKGIVEGTERNTLKKEKDKEREEEERENMEEKE